MDDSAALRRRLRVELRRLRSQSTLTQRDVAKRLDWSPSKVIRIESGQVGISVTDLRALAALYGVTDDARVDALVDMARGSKRQPFAEFRDVLPPDTIRFFGYEASASLIRHVQPLVVPGLLQTEGYTRALLTAYGASGDVIDRVIDSRRERQEVLDGDGSPEVFTILDEGVVRRCVGGPAVMTKQLEHLQELDSRRGFSIQVMPFGAGAYEALQGAFVHLEFADPSDPDIVFLDNDRAGASFIDDPAVTGTYQEKFFTFEEAASGPGQLTEYAERAIKSFG